MLHSEQATPMTDAQKGEFKKLRVNIHTREVTLGDISRKSRLQVVTLLDYLVKHPQHEISFSEFNTVFHENFFDGSSSAKQKISTLKYEVNEVLKDMGFELLRLPPGKLVMATKKGELTLPLSPFPHPTPPYILPHIIILHIPPTVRNAHGLDTDCRPLAVVVKADRGTPLRIKPHFGHP